MSTAVPTGGNSEIGTLTSTAQICPTAAAQDYIITDLDETLAWDMIPVDYE